MSERAALPPDRIADLLAASASTVVAELVALGLILAADRPDGSASRISEPDAPGDRRDRLGQAATTTSRGLSAATR